MHDIYQHLLSIIEFTKNFPLIDGHSLGILENVKNLEYFSTTSSGLDNSASLACGKGIASSAAKLGPAMIYYLMNKLLEIDYLC